MKFSFGKGNSDLRTRLEDKKRAKRKAPGVTKRAHGRGGRWGLGLFFALFFCAGAGFTIFFFVLPGLKLWDSQDWPGVSAVVTHSDVEENRSSDGTTYKIDIHFEYQVNGRRYTSETYDFFSSMSSSGSSGKHAVVSRYPVGHRTTAYVNPDDPTVAVLSRGWNHNIWFVGIPLVFVVIGGGGLFWMLRSGSRGDSKTRGATGADRVGPRSVDDWLPALVKKTLRDGGIDGRVGGDDLDAVSPTKSRWGKLGFVLLFTLIWEGVTFAVVWNIVQDGIKDNVVPALFMIPFVLVGIGCLVGVIYMLLAMSNPIVRMRFDPRVIPLGSPLRVDWRIDGRAERFERLMVTVEAAERATYTRGTDTITDEHVFFEHTLYDARAMDRRDPLAREGEAELELPADAMHSMEARHNKIVWRIKVKGEIPKWPDVSDEYEFAVVPVGVTDGGPNVRGMF
ncbi:MAG: DUF3592 domain-containing protein [Planctomycetota bacterium]